MNVTELKVSYANGSKREEYGPVERAEVQLTVALRDGEDYEGVLNAAMGKAVAKVREVLSGKAPVVPSHKEQLAVEAGLVDRVPASEAPRSKQSITDVAKPVKYLDRQTRRTPPKVTATPKPELNDDLGGLDDLEVMQTDQEDLNDLLGSEPEPEPVKEITDEELLSKITHVNGHTNNPKAIRALVEQFTPNDRKYQAREITQDKREAFIAALGKVPKLTTAGT
jgi:hypothetical protein